MSHRERHSCRNLIYQRDIELTDLTLHQLRDFHITLLHAPKSSLENPSWAHKSGPRSFVSISYGELDQYEGHWVLDETTRDEGFLDEHEDLFWVCDEDQCFWMKYPFQGRSLRKGGKSKGGKGKPGKSKGKGSTARQFFRPYRKGGGKGKKTGKSSGSAAKANIAGEEVEEEEIEDDALLSDRKKRKRKPQAKRKGKAQPAGSAVHEADAAVDDDSFAYSAVSFPYDTISSSKEWRLKGAKGVQEEVEDGTSIYDLGFSKMHVSGALKNPAFCSVQLSDKCWGNPTIFLDFWFCRNVCFCRVSKMHILGV